MKKDLYTLNTDNEFQQLIRPLTSEERKQLEANIVADGCRDPITVWNGIIIDGHNRYEICHNHNIPFNIHKMNFDSREDVIQWICANQLGRRNISEEARKFLIGKQYETEKVINARRNEKGYNQYKKADKKCLLARWSLILKKLRHFQVIKLQFVLQKKIMCQREQFKNMVFIQGQLMP